MTADDFSWRDGERLIRFGVGSLAAAPALLDEHGFAGYVLVTTARAEADAAVLVPGAALVVHVPHGGVPEAAASIRDEAAGRPLVAFGGGRVVDAAKAIGAVEGQPVAVVPTTLSGAPMTRMHRLPAGVSGVPTRRATLVVFDPEVAATHAAPELAASGLNALAHATESLYGPGRNPVCDIAALRAAALLANGLAPAAPDRAAVTLGALLAGYAVDSAGIAIHHVLCQTIVRVTGLPHAKVYAVMLPHTAAFVAARAPQALAPLAAALGADEDAAAVGPAIARVAARAEVPGLRALGFDPAQVPEILATALARPDLAHTPGPPVTGAELEQIIASAQ